MLILERVLCAFIRLSTLHLRQGPFSLVNSCLLRLTLPFGGIFYNYSPKAKLILMNNPLDLIRLGDYSTILTEPEVNNCFSIFTRSDLNRIRKETIKKRLVWLTGEFMREHEAVKSGCAKVRSLQYLQTWQMIVLIFLYRIL